MKKIIWITSFPKSGNTWVRYLIANYFFNFNREFDPKIIRYINSLHLSKYVNKNGKRTPLNHVAKYWIKAQEELEINNGNIAFLKNHHANIKFDGHSYTNSNLTLCVIHVVRDPRDVVISALDYWGKDNYDQIIDLISNYEFFTGYHAKNDRVDEVIGSWSVNFNSWRNTLTDVPKLIIKYEDLVLDCKKEFSKIINFLSEIINFKVDEELIDMSVKLSSFKNLSIAEKNGDFIEGSQIKGNFFRKGTTGQYKEKLNLHQIKKIEEKFKEEMQYLGYL